MEWRRIVKGRWPPTIGSVVGVPGLLDDLESWQRMVGDMSAGWQGVVIGAGAGVIGLWAAANAIAFISNAHPRWPIIRLYALWYVLPGIALAAVVSVVGYLAYYAVFVYEPPANPTWQHPELSDQERREAMAKCRMAAIEATSGGHPVTAIGAAEAHEHACLTLKGFVFQ